MSNYATYPSLKDKVVLVAGGSSGIGAGIVEHFCMQGSKVAFLDIDQQGAEKLVQKIAQQNLSAPLFISCNLKKTDDIKQAIKQVRQQLGSINILVNNAANDERHKLSAITEQQWDDLVAINLRYQFFTAQAVIPDMMQAGGGVIINLSSISYLMTNNFAYPIYAGCKAAIHALTRSLAAEFGKQNIRVNSVMPGWVMTEKQKKLWVTEQTLAEHFKQQLLPQELLEADIARMILFLSADDGAMCTSQNYIVDGGRI